MIRRYNSRAFSRNLVLDYIETNPGCLRGDILKAMSGQTKTSLSVQLNILKSHHMAREEGGHWRITTLLERHITLGPVLGAPHAA
jgi:hypothetical protein